MKKIPFFNFGQNDDKKQDENSSSMMSFAPLGKNSQIKSTHSSSKNEIK